MLWCVTHFKIQHSLIFREDSITEKLINGLVNTVWPESPMTKNELITDRHLPVLPRHEEVSLECQSAWYPSSALGYMCVGQEQSQHDAMRNVTP